MNATAKNKKLHQRENFIWKVMFAPTAITLLCTTVFPTLFSLYNSLFQWNMANPQYGKKFVGLGNFIKILTDQSFYNALFNSIRISFTATVIEFIVGMGIALIFYTGFKGVRFFRTLLLIPTMITPVVASLMWLLMFNPDYGIFRYFTELLGVNPAPLWLADKILAPISIIIVDVWQWTPFVAILLLAGLLSVPTEIIEAARVDGANRLRIFTSVLLPSMKSTVLIALLIRVMDTMKLFEPIYILTKGGPGQATETLTYRTYKEAFGFFEIGTSTTISLLFLVVITIISQLLIKIAKDEWDL